MGRGVKFHFYIKATKDNKEVCFPCWGVNDRYNAELYKNDIMRSYPDYHDFSVVELSLNGEPRKRKSAPVLAGSQFDTFIFDEDVLAAMMGER